MMKPIGDGYFHTPLTYDVTFVFVSFQPTSILGRNVKNRKPTLLWGKSINGTLVCRLTSLRKQKHNASVDAIQFDVWLNKMHILMLFIRRENSHNTRSIPTACFGGWRPSASRLMRTNICWMFSYIPLGLLLSKLTAGCKFNFQWRHKANCKFLISSCRD